MSLCWKLSAARPKLRLFLPRDLSLSAPTTSARPLPTGELARRKRSILWQPGTGAQPKLAGQRSGTVGRCSAVLPPAARHVSSCGQPELHGGRRHENVEGKEAASDTDRRRRAHARCGAQF